MKSIPAKMAQEEFLENKNLPFYKHIHSSTSICQKLVGHFSDWLKHGLYLLVEA